MRLRNNIFIFAFLAISNTVIMLSCTHSRRDLILGDWKGMQLENARMDSLFIKSQHFIDTMGRNNTPDENYDFYGTYNMDSLRRALQSQHDSAWAAKRMNITNTVFRFEKDKMAYVTFNNFKNTDTAQWSFDEDGYLLLEDRSQAGGRAVKKMEIVDINDKILKFKIWTSNDSSIVTLQKIKAME